MATFTERIQIIVDAATGQATRNLQGFRQEMQQAEGFSGKLKTGLAGVKQNLGGLAVGAAAGGLGAAFAFVGKAVGDFQNLALAMGDVSDKTGLTIEEASRWNEVAGDIGISIDAVATATNKLNRVETTRLQELGITGQTANERLLQTVELLANTKDAADRARIGTELLGKGWQTLAPLVDQSAKLRDNLKDVADSKVITEEENAKAERFRATMDDLNDVVEELSLVLGEAAVPLLTRLGDAVQRLNDLGVPRIFEWLSKGGTIFDVTRWMVENIVQGRSPTEAWRALGNGGVDTTGNAVAGTRTEQWIAAGRPASFPVEPSVTVVNNYPPGTDPRRTEGDLRDWYRKNGTR